MTNWRVIRSARDPKFMVKGYELADTFLHHHRFRIVETRAMITGPSEWRGYYMGVNYRVYDAHTVTDAEIRAGKSARMIGVFDTFDQAIAECDRLQTPAKKEEPVSAEYHRF